MLNSLKLFFREKMGLKEVTPSSSLQRAMQVATCAVLLEAAMADNELSGEELDHIYAALQHLYNMDKSDIDPLLEMTRKESKESVDLWQFTNLINQNYNSEQKILLMEHIWKVILSDETLDQFEDYLARNLFHDPSPKLNPTLRDGARRTDSRRRPRCRC